MKCKKPHPAFELGQTYSFTTTIIIAPVDKDIIWDTLVLRSQRETNGLLSWDSELHISKWAKDVDKRADYLSPKVVVAMLRGRWGSLPHLLSNKWQVQLQFESKVYSLRRKIELSSPSPRKNHHSPRQNWIVNWETTGVFLESFICFPFLYGIEQWLIQFRSKPVSLIFS